MSSRLDLPIALVVWLTGFAWVARTGSWTVLAVLQVLAAARLVTGDPMTRRLLRPSRLTTAIGLAAGLLSIVLTYALYGPLSQLFPELPRALRRLYGIMNSLGYEPWALASIILVVIAAEEIVWRGRMLERGADGSSRPLAWKVAQSLLFGAIYAAAHSTSGSGLLVFVAFAFGAAWALLRVLTGSLWTPLVAHALWDMAVLVVWPLSP
jgi:membrane protease YdiL (CAAX protease family)